MINLGNPWANNFWGEKLKEGWESLKDQGVKLGIIKPKVELSTSTKKDIQATVDETIKSLSAEKLKELNLTSPKSREQLRNIVHKTLIKATKASILDIAQRANIVPEGKIREDRILNAAIEKGLIQKPSRQSGFFVIAKTDIFKSVINQELSTSNKRDTLREALQSLLRKGATPAERRNSENEEKQRAAKKVMVEQSFEALTGLSLQYNRNYESGIKEIDNTYIRQWQDLERNFTALPPEVKQSIAKSINAKTIESLLDTPRLVRKEGLEKLYQTIVQKKNSLEAREKDASTDMNSPNIRQELEDLSKDIESFNLAQQHILSKTYKRDNGNQPWQDVEVISTYVKKKLG